MRCRKHPNENSLCCQNPGIDIVVKRTFLLLQGVCSPFFGRLANRLLDDGHRVFTVNFNAGDALYRGGAGAWNYREPLSCLRDFLDHKYRTFDITDQVLFGDRRPVHRPAVEHGKACGVRTHVFEEGYFRPCWVTLEREGVNRHSLLPRDPAWFRAVGTTLPEPDPVVSFESPFRYRAAHDVVYHLSNALNPVLFPHYRAHATVAAPVEYAGYLKRFGELKLIRMREYRRVRALIESGIRYYVLPLQLNSDAQIRDHSRFAHMGEVITSVLESFAKHAPEDARIVIKNHPLDTGLMNFTRIVRVCERQFGLVGRTVYLEDGDLVSLVRQAQGVVTVNSTVGLVALEQGTPTVTLSDPMYNVPGLTFQGPLDDFWVSRIPPNAGFFALFRRVVMQATQVNGGFYCRQGINLAVENSSRILTALRSPLEALR